MAVAKGGWDIVGVLNHEGMCIALQLAGPLLEAEARRFRELAGGCGVDFLFFPFLPCHSELAGVGFGGLGLAWLLRPPLSLS